MKKIIFFVFIFLYSALHADTPILIIHSYHESYLWSANQDKGFKQVVNNEKGLYPAYSTEYIDSKRRDFNKEYEHEFIHYLKAKYKGYQPKLIYTTDDDAFNFMLTNKDKIFPDVPLIFSGVNDISKIHLLENTKSAGIFETKEIVENIQLINTLFPQEKEVLFLGDSSTTAKAIEENVVQKYKFPELKTHSIYGKNYQNTLQELKNYKGKVIILTTIGGFHNKAGHLVPLQEVLHDVQSLGKFIIIALEDIYIQEGVLGGVVNVGTIQGNEAGKIALEVLKNPTSKFPKSVLGRHDFMFDVQVLDKLGISLPDDIVQKSKFINQPESFAYKYAYILMPFIYMLLIILVLGSLYFALYMYRSKKIILKDGEKLATITESMEKAQSIAHLGNWDWDIKNNTLWWSNEIYRIFGLKPQEFDATYEAFIARVHPGDRDKVNEAVNLALEHKSDYRIVHRILQSDGTERKVLEEGSLKLDEMGIPVRMIGIVHDITEQQKAKEKIQTSEKKYRDLVENSMVGIYRTTLAGEVLYVNPALIKMFSYDSEDEIIGKNCIRMYNSPQDREKMMQILLNTGHVTNYEVLALNKNNKSFPIMLSALLEDDTVTGMMIDMSELKKTQGEIEKLSKVVEQIDDAVSITDKRGIITYANQAFYNLTGYSKDEIIGKTLNILKSGQHSMSFYKDLWSTILKGDVFRETMINKKKNGELFYEKKTITPFKDEKNNIVGYISSGKDITREAMMQKEIEYIASIDSLTCIYNRHKFEELFNLELERSRRFSHPLSLLLIDIDHFKIVNDTFGHDVGDEVLKTLVHIVQKHIRKIDVFARWGGEEFLVLAPGTNLEQMYMLAEKLRLAVEDFEFPTVKDITVSIGISQLEEDDSFKEFFKRADKELYDAKANGRNQVSPVC